jgi:hypothetical protein
MQGVHATATTHNSAAAGQGSDWLEWQVAKNDRSQESQEKVQQSKQQSQQQQPQPTTQQLRADNQTQPIRFRNMK